MDIAAMSVMLSQGNVKQQAGISVLKLAMGAAAEQGAALAAIAEAAGVAELSVQPHLGGNLDIQV